MFDHEKYLKDMSNLNLLNGLKKDRCYKLHVEYRFHKQHWEQRCHEQLLEMRLYGSKIAERCMKNSIEI